MKIIQLWNFFFKPFKIKSSYIFKVYHYIGLHTYLYPF